MSHLHIPDGVLPPWLIVIGWIVTAALLTLAGRSLSPGDRESRLPLLGVMSALMLVGMSLELVPIGYHLNLTVIGGIVLGPALGFIATFIVTLILAFLGHGGITVVGLNSLVLGVEIVLGYYLFHGLRALLPPRVGAEGAAAAATVISLATSTLVMIGIVGSSNVNPAFATPEATALEPGRLSFRNPFGEGVLSWEAPSGEQYPSPQTRIDLATFAKLVLALGAIGWTLEAFVTAILTRFVATVRPDLVEVPRGPAVS